MTPKPEPTAAEPEQTRKNILLISLDDCVSFWRYKTVFGERLHTPNLDRICDQSTAFHAAYCQSPICGPSRSSFMTGRTPHQTGVFTNRQKVFDDIRPKTTWPFRLKQNGYWCSSGGKVHHGYKPLPHAVHHILYSDERKGFRIDRKLPEHIPQKALGGHAGGLATTDPADDGYYHDAMAAGSFIDFLKSYDRDAPFYREVGFYGPHGPFITPLRYKEMYRVRNFEQPSAWAGGFHENPYATEHMVQNFSVNEERWRRSVRNYFSALTHVDHHLGIVWDTLKSSRFADNTIVILVSDHGMHLGERTRFRKTTLWEQVAAVPMIVHDPAQPLSREVHDPVALLDLGPTIMDYAQLPALKGCVGRSLRPQVEGAAVPDRVVPTFHYGNVGVRKDQYRLIRYEDGSTEFYDLEQDWWQTTDLRQDHPDFKDTYDALVACAQSYGLDVTAETGDMSLSG